MFDLAWSIGVGVQFSTLGVEATVVRPSPNDTPISTSVIWLDTSTNDDPSAARNARRERTRIAALRRSEVDSAPKGTRIEAAETDSGTVKTWIVDGTDRVDTDQLRVVVIERP